jgi:hypothetical protein
MTKNLKAAMDLYYCARELKAAGLRCQHPNWSEERIREEILDIFSDAAESALQRNPSCRLQS